ncbi:hypothetical protein DPMN_165183 [Dreissena polymorpha]|uniref:Uncharacterized protein n=1 Tax=Dreissena polymorpha TaxID=45954 RepID=A0A9D4EWN0_DREPO|nr:hypothetical protein DPMN_165183 [Dreissena polymorpha]
MTFVYYINTICKKDPIQRYNTKSLARQRLPHNFGWARPMLVGPRIDRVVIRDIDRVVIRDVQYSFDKIMLKQNFGWAWLSTISSYTISTRTFKLTHMFQGSSANNGQKAEINTISPRF